MKNFIIECGAALEDGFFVRNHFVQEEEVNDFIQKHNNKGVFTSAYMYDSEDIKSANLIGDYYLDFDHNTDYDLVKKDVLKTLEFIQTRYGLNPNCLHIFFSGSKGIHITIPYQYLGVTPCKNLNLIYKAMTDRFAIDTKATTIDKKIYDSRRLFRIPNSIHQKSGLYKVEISYEELKNMEIEEIAALATEPRPIKKMPILAPTTERIAQSTFNMLKTTVNNSTRIIPERRETINRNNTSYIPPCIDHLLNVPVTTGSRNEATAVLASFYNQNGYTEEETIEILKEWNQNMVDPPIEERELLTTIKSLYKSNYQMGCTRAKEVSICNEKDCKMFKSIVK